MDSLFDAEELLSLARLDLQKGDVAAGLGRLKQALQKPDCPTAALVEAARVYAQLGLRKKAQPLFGQYLEQSPNDVDARFQLGMVAFEDGEIGAALSVWEQVLQSTPVYPPALFYRAAALVRQGDATEGRRLLRSAMDVIEADNLYFKRSKDLLAAIESGQGTGIVVAPEQAYRNQH